MSSEVGPVEGYRVEWARGVGYGRLSASRCVQPHEAPVVHDATCAGPVTTEQNEDLRSNRQVKGGRPGHPGAEIATPI
jgi:hypothetical protein